MLSRSGLANRKDTTLPRKLCLTFSGKRFIVPGVDLISFIPGTVEIKRILFWRRNEEKDPSRSDSKGFYFLFNVIFYEIYFLGEWTTIEYHASTALRSKEPQGYEHCKLDIGFYK